MRRFAGAEDGAAQGRETWVCGDIARDEITREVGIGQFEKFAEQRAFARGGVRCAQVTQQQQVELLHPAAAAPLQLADFSVQRIRD